MIDRTHALAVHRQAALLGLSRAAAYYTSRAVPATDLALMRRIDALHFETPVCRQPHAAGSPARRRLRDGARPRPQPDAPHGDYGSLPPPEDQPAASGPPGPPVPLVTS